MSDFIDHILHSNRLSRSDAERFRGRLQFASNYLFGRRFRNCLRELNSHISRGFATPSDEFKSVFVVLKDLLHDNLPRIVDTRFFEWVHLYVDVSFEPGGSSGIGGLLLDQSGNCLGFFSESVSEDLVTQIKSDDQKTIIFELEGLAVAIGLSVFQKLIAGKRLIVFTDNQAVQSCLIKCKSSSENMDLIIKHVCRSEEKLNILAWIERVPSQSNPSDVLSREIVILQKISISVDLLNACAQLYFQWMSVERNGQKRKDDRRTNREVSHTTFAVESMKHGIISHYFEALGSAGKQEWPLLRMVAELHELQGL